MTTLPSRIFALVSRVLGALLRHPSLTVAGALLLFVLGALSELIDETFDDEGRAVEMKILQLFRNPEHPAELLGPTWFEEAMRDITGLGGFTVLSLVTLMGVIYLLILKRQAHAYYLAGTIITGTVLGNLIKYSVGRERPDFVPHGVVTLSASFPSAHSLMSAVVYLTVGAVLAESESRLGLKLYFFGAGILLTMLIGVTRLYFGVHWPSDVLAGWLIGFGWALLCWIVSKYLHLRRKDITQARRQ